MSEPLSSNAGMNLTWLYLLIIGGTLWAITRQLIPFVQKIYIARQEQRLSLEQRQLTVLSQQTAKHIIDMIEDYQKNTGNAMKDFITLATESQEKLEQRINKIASQISSETTKVGGCN